MTLSASTLQPAGLPLRAFPEVFILRGHLDEEIRLGRGLAEHLRQFGHMRTYQLTEEDLRARLRAGPVPPAAVIVELQLDFAELLHQQFGAPMHTICDSLSCYVMPSPTSRDVPVMWATLTLTARDATTMEVHQRVRLKALELGGDSEDMRKEVTLTLLQRARVLVDHRRTTAQVSLFSPDVPGVDDAIEAAEDGDWEGARRRLADSLRARGPSLSRGARAQVLYDLAQTEKFACDGADPVAMTAAMRAMSQARKLEPGRSEYAEALRAMGRDLQNAKRIRIQWVAAARNHRLAAGVPQESMNAEDSGQGAEGAEVAK